MKALMRKLRPLGVGIARSLDFMQQNGGLAVVASSAVNAGTVIAVVPEASVVSTASLADNDPNGFFPLIEELAECTTAVCTGTLSDAFREDGILARKLLEELALAHHLSIGTFLDDESWFSWRLLTSASPRGHRRMSDSHDMVSIAFHQRLSTRFVTAPFARFQDALRYVKRCAVTAEQLPLFVVGGVNEAPGRCGGAGSQCTSRGGGLVHLIPFVDSLFPERERAPGQEQNCPCVTLHRWSADELRAYLRRNEDRKGPHAIRGARQQLVCKDGEASYCVAVVHRDVEKGEPLTMAHF